MQSGGEIVRDIIRDDVRDRKHAHTHSARKKDECSGERKGDKNVMMAPAEKRQRDKGSQCRAGGLRAIQNNNSMTLSLQAVPSPGPLLHRLARTTLVCSRWIRIHYPFA